VLIDWFTIAAQIVNFLVLVLLLRHFLYGPIVKAMDERKEHILAQIKEAERREEIAETEAQRLRTAKAELENQRSRMLVEAEQEVEARRKELIQEARQEADDLRRHWQIAVEQAKERFLGELRQGTVRQVYAVARRALSDLADVDLERQMVAVFLQRLRAMDEEELREILPANDERAALVVYSAFALPPADRQSIVETFQQLSGKPVKVEFEATPRLIGGLELRSPNRRVAWNLARYLRNLEADMSRRLDRIDHMDPETREGHEPVPEAAGPIAV
jgi:F-type H+-transporting ATPase subunit b